jgi:micrococcal nuclease
MLRYAFAALIFVVQAPALHAMEGPVAADVVRVVDGDTFVARALVWPGHSVEVSVRIRGIDAPETRTRCEAEKTAGLEAAGVLERMLESGRIYLTNIGSGKFYGRVLADVANAEGRDVASAMLHLGLAKPYSGGRRTSQCLEAGRPETEHPAEPRR